MRTGYFTTLGLALICALILNLSPQDLSDRTPAQVDPPNGANPIYLPAFLHTSTMPKVWQIYVNLEDHFRFVVPADWTLEELPGQSSPLREYIMVDNIPEDRTGIPLSFEDPAWPSYLHQIEFITIEEPLDPTLSFEENSRRLIENGLTTVTGFYEDPHYPNGTFIELGRQNVPAHHAMVFSRVYASGDMLRLMIVALYPNTHWDNPVIQFIVNSLDFQ